MLYAGADVPAGLTRSWRKKRLQIGMDGLPRSQTRLPVSARLCTTQQSWQLTYSGMPACRASHVQRREESEIPRASVPVDPPRAIVERPVTARPRGRT